MEATAAISLLFAHQSGVINTAVDAIVPVYTFAVLYLLYTVHKQHSSLQKGSPPSDEAFLITFEKELLATAAAAKARAAAAAAAAANTPKGGKRKKSNTGGGNTTHIETQTQTQEGGGLHPNFSGVWKSIPSKNVNYEEFLTVQGVPYLKRKIATTTVVTHIIEQEGDQFKLEVQPLGMKTTFNINGPPTISHIGKKAFEDSMNWGPDGEQVILVKANHADSNEITAVRQLTEGGKYLVMKQWVKNLKDGTETHAEQTFEKAS